jgi:hypothetical protein
MQLPGMKALLLALFPMDWIEERPVLQMMSNKPVECGK